MSEGVCPFTLTWNLLYYTFLTGVLLIVVIVQNVLLDVYIIYNDHTNSQNYFWLVSDFLLVFGFVAAMAKGYRNQKPKRSSVCQNDYKAKPQALPTLHSRIFGKHYLPFYVWMVYSALLVAKTVIIFKSEIPSKLDANDRLSPQLLEMALYLSFIVFALLVKGQENMENTEVYYFVMSLIGGIALEIIDSVTFLSLLIQSKSHYVLPLTLENAIICFSCLNFLFPGIALVKLSRSDYGHSAVCVFSSVLYRFCHLWFVNFTYFIIRLYLWGGLSVNISPFILKNVYHMLFTLSSLWMESKLLWNFIRANVEKRKRVYTAETGSTGMTEGIEMNAVSSSMGERVSGSGMC